MYLDDDNERELEKRKWFKEISRMAEGIQKAYIYMQQIYHKIHSLRAIGNGARLYKR